MWNGPEGKGFFRRLITRERCGHMSGLLVRFVTAGLDEVREAEGACQGDIPLSIIHKIKDIIIYMRKRPGVMTSPEISLWLNKSLLELLAAPRGVY